MKDLGARWDSVPAFLRDFLEGCVAAAVGGASAAVLGLNLDTATPKQVVAVALIGAVAAIIAFARHKLVQPPA